jgi:hypothetical protein
VAAAAAATAVPAGTSNRACAPSFSLLSYTSETGDADAAAVTRNKKENCHEGKLKR